MHRIIINVYLCYNVIKRWARLEIPPKGGRGFHFGTPQTNFSGFKRWQAKKRKKKSFAHFYTFSPSVLSFPPPLLQFPSPLSIFPCLFSPSLLFSPPPSLFPSSFPLSSLPPSFKNYPETFQGWGTRPPHPPLATPLHGNRQYPHIIVRIILKSKRMMSTSAENVNVNEHDASTDAIAFVTQRIWLALSISKIDLYVKSSNESGSCFPPLVNNKLKLL